MVGSISYNRDIPDAPNNPSNDQPLMKANTDAIDDLLAVDHISFNVGAGLNSGNHNVIHFNNQSVDPIDLLGLGELYTKTDTKTNDNQLYYRSGNDVIYQMTGLKQITSSISGFMLLAGGNLLLQYGQDTQATAVSGSFTFARPFTTLYTIVTGLQTPAGNVTPIIITSSTNTGFNWRVGSNGIGVGVTVYYIALGKQ